MFHFPSFKLDNFEGPLELLLYLIQKEEIDPCGVVVKQLTAQLMERVEDVDLSSEMVALTASLLLLKSEKLLPEAGGESEELADNPRLEVIQNLIEYCRLRDLAKTLAEKEEEQRAYFPRALQPFQKEVGLGLEEIDHHVLKHFLAEALQRAEKLPQKMIQAEEWQVADKLVWLRAAIKTTPRLSLETLFVETMSRQELIVTFLALLELLKYQEIKLSREEDHLYLSAYEIS